MGFFKLQIRYKLTATLLVNPTTLYLEATYTGMKNTGVKPTEKHWWQCMEMNMSRKYFNIYL